MKTCAEAKDSVYEDLCKGVEAKDSVYEDLDRIQSFSL